MKIDPANPVVALCAAGMAIEGDAHAARKLFEQAWASCTDDYESAIAAHFLARHQATPEACLHWNAAAVQHAEAVTNGSTVEFLASLYLNLADAHFALGDLSASARALASADTHVLTLPDDGYRAFVERGIAGLRARVEAAGQPMSS